MSKVCYLHFGFLKTASTSFQNTCANNVALLKEHKITYPLFNCEAANKYNMSNHTMPIASQFHENPRQYSHNIVIGVSNQAEEVNHSYTKQLETILESSENLLISGEGISTALSEAALERLVKKIQKYGYEIKAIVIVRSPFASLCSGLAQKIKSGKYIKLITLNNSASPSVKPEKYDQDFPHVDIIPKLKSIFRGYFSLRILRESVLK